MPSHFADVNDVQRNKDDTPIFWHMPRSAGQSMKHLIVHRLKQVAAAEAVTANGQDTLNDSGFTVITQPHGRYVSVGMYTVGGINDALRKGLIPSRSADVIFTPSVTQAQMLFDGMNFRGRLFTLMRNPVERIVSLYHFHLTSHRIEYQSLEEFSKTEAAGQDWMVRTLTGTMSGPINESHLNTAKEILR